LRYHPSVYYRAGQDSELEIWPALLAAVTALDGTITGVQRTWLDRNRPAKAPIADPRRAMGHLLGNGVRLGTPSDILAAGEGIETMLALKSVLPNLPMIAGLSANHLAALNLPSSLQRLYVARDNDAEGLRAANRLTERNRSIEVRQLVPLHDDFNLDLCRLGADGLRVQLRDQLVPDDHILIAQSDTPARR
jgi:Toprim domain